MRPQIWIFFTLLAAELHLSIARGKGTKIYPVNQLNSSVPIDFSSAASTKPAKTGTQLPATCSMGENVPEDRCGSRS
jgi:hypothetical protein